MVSVVFLKLTLSVPLGNRSPNDAQPTVIFVPIDAVASLRRFSGDLYEVNLKKEYLYLIDSRFETPRATLTKEQIAIIG